MKAKILEQYNLQVATLIKTDGTKVELTPANGKSFKYEEIRNAIGNYIEPITLRYYTNDKDFKKMNFICDEEGAINGSGLNKEASDLLRWILGPDVQELYGNVVFCPNKLFRL